MPIEAFQRSGHVRLVLAAALLLGRGRAEATAGDAPTLGTDFASATPESQGMSREKLDALREELARRKTRAFLVVRSDKIVYEWYAPGSDASKKQGTASLAKALVAGLSLGVAVTDGRISLDDPAAKYVPQWKDDPQKSRISVRHLGSHTSGLEDAEANRLPHESLSGWKGDFWKRLEPPADPFSIARDQTPVLFEPGRKLSYSNPGIGLLTYCVTAAIQGSKPDDIRTLLRERVMRPIGVPDADWSCGYGKTFAVDGLPLVASWGGGSFTPRAAARIGQLLLHGGDWSGTRVLSEGAVRAITGDAGLPGNCGMGFWTNAAGRYPFLPKDAYWGAGAGDQLLLVVPSMNLVLVRNGETLAPPPEDAKDVFEEFHDPRANLLFKALLEAVAEPARPTVGTRPATSASYPPSSVITAIEWAPKETIVRKARGSDNWPLTWADDDALYAAYGDGRGFEPFVDTKLSLGLARIDGGPGDFSGVNIRAATLEERGDGAVGKKASGLLMVDGVLYLWARNAGNSRLAWSKDHGGTWTWADWRFDRSFGCPTFLNFGKDYAGARDGFVYVYSPDSDSAYEPADRMVLARVPRTEVIVRAAYEFFRGLGASGQPMWTKDLAERGAVLADAGRCYRSGISYDAGLKRYLWCRTLPGTQGERADTRFAGGLAIQDAPEPWGPWTTVFATERWDVGPGETSSFPPKWMSADGETLHLVFSGDDCFSVRRATLTIAETEGRTSGGGPR
jgi:CubicO group peptidase (beta-lactamase class C family)